MSPLPWPDYTTTEWEQKLKQHPLRGLSHDDLDALIALAGPDDLNELFDIISLEFDESKVSRDAHGRFGSGGEAAAKKVDWQAAGKKAAEAKARHEKQFEESRTVTGGVLKGKQAAVREQRAKDAAAKAAAAKAAPLAPQNPAQKAAEARARHQEQYDKGQPVTAGVLRDKQQAEGRPAQDQKAALARAQAIADQLGQRPDPQAAARAEADVQRAGEMRAQWQAAKDAAAARAAEGEPRFTEPGPGQAGYVPVGRITAANVDDSLTHPITLTGTKSATKLGGHNVNEVLKLTTADGAYAFKPIDGEKFTHFGYVRQAVTNRDAPLAEREVLASRVSNAMFTPETSVVPPTAMANATYSTPGGGTVTKMGSAQDFVPNTGSIMTYRREQLPADQRARIGVLDAVIGNLDRHGHNFLVSTDGGRVMGIDHGYSFGDSPIKPGAPAGGYPKGGVAELRSWALAGIKAGDLSVAEQHTIADKLDKMNANWSGILKGAHLNTQERATLTERTKAVAGYLHNGKAHEIQSTFKAQRY
jgi:hypothetical protein